MSNMETAMFLVGALAALTGAVAGVLFSMSHRDAGLWLSCATVVLLVVGGFCWLQDSAWKSDAEEQKKRTSAEAEERLAKLSDILLPANEVTPNLNIPPGRPSGIPEEAVTVAKGEMIIFVGDFAISTAESSFVVLKLYGKDLLKITKVENGISVSADIWDEDGKIFATIENNRFRVNPNKTIPLIRPDPHTLIVEDERKIRVLSVRFLNPSTVKIGGIFRAGGKYPVIVSENEITFGPLLIKGGFVLHVKGRSVFEWPGQFPDAKGYLSPNDKIETGKAMLGVAMKNGAFNVILKDSRGGEYSIFQVGGSDVPEGTEIWGAGSFQLRSTDAY